MTYKRCRGRPARRPTVPAAKPHDQAVLVAVTNS
jgi:hypothetical protein